MVINKIKKTRKRMAKVQKRSYEVILKSARSMLFRHLCNHLDAKKVLLHLDNGFEKQLFLASLKNLSDKGNPVRFNNFAYCMREIIGLILSKYSDDADIKQCKWYEKPDDTEVTRLQRVIYSICGGMDRNYVKEVILAIEEDDENIFDETLKIFSKKFNELNKYTHVRSDNTFNISNDLCEKLSIEVIKLTSDIVSLIDDCRYEIRSHVYEQIHNAVTDESIRTTLEGLDILSTHGYVNYVDINEYEVSSITSKYIVIQGDGKAHCTLEWGSGSDFRNGNGSTREEEFPLHFKAHISLDNLNDITIFEGDIDIDNSSWFE